MFRLRSVTAATAAFAIASVVAASPINAYSNNSSDTATYLTSDPARIIDYSNGMDARPHLAWLDTNNDGQRDVYAYCIEPRVITSPWVSSGVHKLKKHKMSDYQIQDPGRVRWVLQNGFPARSVSELRASLTTDTSGVTDERLRSAFSSATQAAIYKFSHGYDVSPNFRVDTRTVPAAHQASAAFTEFYGWLISHAQFVVDAGFFVVWDVVQGTNQGVIEVPSKPTPTPTLPPVPTPTVPPAPAPTVTVPPAPAPTVTVPPAPAPTVTVPPAPAPTVTVPPAPAPTVTGSSAPSPAPSIPSPTHASSWGWLAW